MVKRFMVGIVCIVATLMAAAPSFSLTAAEEKKIRDEERVRMDERVKAENECIKECYDRAMTMGPLWGRGDLNACLKGCKR